MLRARSSYRDCHVRRLWQRYQRHDRDPLQHDSHGQERFRNRSCNSTVRLNVIRKSMRRFFRILFLAVLGVTVGIIGYESIMLVRVLWLRNSNPSSTSLIDTRIKEARAKGQQPRREQAWVPLDRISPNLQRAVLAGEDTNFLTHRGFDYEAIQKAWEQAQREAAREAKREGEDDDWLPNFPEFKRGASTISQQLAKNLYLSSQRSFIRKGQEALVTIMLERVLTKRRILEIYLNVIEWGDGVYGAEAASQRYFH